jgi:hypothetical protein
MQNKKEHKDSSQYQGNIERGLLRNARPCTFQELHQPLSLAEEEVPKSRCESTALTALFTDKSEPKDELIDE